MQYSASNSRSVWKLRIKLHISQTKFFKMQFNANTTKGTFLEHFYNHVLIGQRPMGF
ncbi:hypothetical protein C4J95_5331 [Pseudomonas orientalis]|nr:hypothetical protein C4J96_5370 [Pseudomonas orientalis]AZF02745.1 hypothetical protein C4J95_5331 [Pseudomonas orientalis]